MNASRLFVPAFLTVAVASCSPPARPADPPWPTFTTNVDSLLRGHTISRATAPTALLRYRAPTCAARYEWRSRGDVTLLSPDAPAPSTSIDTRVEFDLVPDGANAAVQVRTSRIALATSGGRNPGADDAAERFGLTLHSGGRAWIERSNPSNVWASLGDIGGVGLGFPWLPPGNTGVGDWAIRLRPSRTEGGAIVNFRVRIARWITVDGQRAAIVQARSAPLREVVREEQLTMTRELQVESVVLESGAVLAAVLVDRRRSNFDVADGAVELSAQSRAELRLRQGCGSPSLDSGFPPVTLRERALGAYARFRTAVVTDRRDDALASIDPAIVTRHGPDTVWNLLRATVTSRGDTSLGAPELSDTDGTTDPSGAFTIRFTGAARVEDSPRLTIAVQLTMRTQGGEPRVRSLGLDSVQSGTTNDLFLLDEHTARGALPSAARESGQSPFAPTPRADAGGVRRRGLFDSLR
jgi:hypothetical protein